MKFKDTDRSPIIPLSFENKDLSRIKEFIIDYINNSAYIKTENGSYVNVLTSENTLNEVGEFIKSNPDMLLNAKIITSEGEKTIQESFSEIYATLIELSTKTFKYAGSDTNGGAAFSAERLNSFLTIKNTDGTTTVYNGEANQTATISNIYSRSGGPISGDVSLKRRLILTEDVMYGTKLPDTGVDGQLFILLEE